MSVFVLKIIACISMAIDHTRFLIGNTPISYLGRIAFPIYAFLIAEGYSHTRSFAKYLGRLLLFAVISQLPAYLLFEPYLNGELYLNIFFTLALGLIAIRFYDTIPNKIVSLLPILATAGIAEILCTDYGGYGVILITAFYIFRDRKVLSFLASSFLIIVYNLSSITNFSMQNSSEIILQLIYILFTLLSLIFIYSYNGELGKSNKYIKMAFYFFYPLHLLLYFGIRVIFIT